MNRRLLMHRLAVAFVLWLAILDGALPSNAQATVALTGRVLDQSTNVPITGATNSVAKVTATTRHQWGVSFTAQQVGSTGLSDVMVYAHSYYSVAAPIYLIVQ
jgi:hypothetical protein